MRNDPTFWLLARASGLLAYVALVATVLAGLVLRARPFARLRPAAVTGVHRFLSLVGLLAFAVHGVALVLDRTVEVTPLALFVPGLIDYRPLPTALGVVAADLCVVLVASFRLRRRIGTTAWRRLHRSAYLVFVLATVHGLEAGTDSGRPGALALYLVAVGLVSGAGVWRVLAPPARPAKRRPDDARGRTPTVGPTPVGSVREA